MFLLKTIIIYSANNNSYHKYSKMLSQMQQDTINKCFSARQPFPILISGEKYELFSLRMYTEEMQSHSHRTEVAQYLHRGP